MYHRSRRRQLVTLSIEGQEVFVTAPTQVLELLETYRIRLRLTEDGRTALCRGPEPLRCGLVRNSLDFIPPQNPDELPIPVGLLPAVLHLLDRQGVPYRIVRVEPLIATVPPPHLHPAFSTTAERHLASFVYRCERGLIEIPEGGGRLTGHCTTLARAFPGGKIAFIAENATFNWSVLAALRRQRIDAHLNALPNSEAESGVVVGTIKSIDPHFLAHADLLVFPRMRDAIGERGQEMLPSALRPRLFGFCRADERLSPYEEAWLFAYYGFARCRLPRTGMSDLDAVVRFLSFRTRQKPIRAASRFELLREAIWASPRRTALVADAAAAIATGDLSCIGISSESEQHQLFRGARKVVVVAANPAHAAAIGNRLPGWPVLDARTPTAGNRFDHVPTTVEKLIVTVTAAEAFNFGQVDVVVRADGGQDAGWLPSDIETRCGGAPLLLVDVRDRHHPRLHELSRRRLVDYARRGWAVNGMASERILMLDFLRRQGSLRHE